MTWLADINLWLALTFSGHDHHRAAVEWFDGIDAGSCAFCRMTQQGYLRLASNPAVFKSDALSMTDAWQAYDALREDERVGFIAEPPGIEVNWRDWTRSAAFSPKLWNDAYLAALSTAAGLKLISFDNGFGQFPGLDWVLLGKRS